MTKKTETEMTHAETITCMRVVWLEDQVAAMRALLEASVYWAVNPAQCGRCQTDAIGTYLDAIEAVDCDQDAYRIDPDDAAAPERPLCPHAPAAKAPASAKKAAAAKKARAKKAKKAAPAKAK